MSEEEPRSGLVVDAHQHFWTAEDVPAQPWRSDGHEAIARAFTPADLAPELAAGKVDATVLIQAADRAEENTSLFRFATEASFVAGVVGWLPLADPEATRTELERIADRPRLVGARCLVGRAPMDWATSLDVADVFGRLASLGLCWDVVPVTGEQRRTVMEVARRFPELRVVINHLARPPIEDRGWEPWAGSVSALAGHPNIAIKLSIGVDVLTSWSSWDVTPVRPFVEHALASFGAERAMLASNWPVSLLRVDYGRAWTDMRGLVEGLGAGPNELAQVCGDSAVRWYGLAEDARR